MLVSIGLTNEPGEDDLYSPQQQMTSTVPVVERIPRSEILDRTLNGIKTGGVTIKNETILKKVVEY